jgi:VanZ family protein
MKKQENSRYWMLLRSRRFWLGFILIVSIFFGIRAIFSFSQMDASVSHGFSKKVAAIIQEWTDNHFGIEPSDSFWKYDLNNIIRKMGHVLEFSLLGMWVCAFLNVLTKRNWLAIIISPFICFSVAYADEYIQQFSEGRRSGWMDVRLDTISAILGILLAGIVFGLFWYIHGLKQKIGLLKSE